jgi:hypothetical protein
MLFRALNLLACVMVSLILAAHARPLYTDGSNKTLALVLCGNLRDAVLALKEREILEHEIGAEWLESNCVSIDPCAQRSSNEDPMFALPLPAAAGVWLSANSSALRLPRARAAILDAEAGLRAENSRSLEFARVPEGLRVEACAPDFDVFRREGKLLCDENTIVVISAESDTRACPGTLPHTLLDCVKPLQFDAVVETLVWRPPGEKMHFGTATWNEACSAELPLPALVRQMCSLLSEYTLQLPVAAAIGSTSLVRYDFLPGYACYDELPEVQGEVQVLSARAAPNRILPCPPVANGTPQRSDLYTCTTACDPGFTLHDGTCVSVCAGPGILQVACPSGFFATAECQQGPVTLYNCSACSSKPGFGGRAAEPGVDDLFSCHYTPCPPGRQSTGLACEDCPVNTFANTSQTLVCASCDTVLTGTYQTATGKSSCDTCLWNVSVEAHTCVAGTSLVQDFDRLLQLFSLYATDHQADVHDYLPDVCSKGYACLPCEPGHYELDRACVPCPYASYQPNFGAQACHLCAAGQNTTSAASKHSSDCVCVEGFE